MANNKDNFEHPIGSLVDPTLGFIGATALGTPGVGTEIVNSIIEPWWSPETSGNTVVKGTYGKTRHAGNFSQSNPYAQQLAVATNNQDKDALYEKAVNWEADRASLEEQRAYDDPSAQVARQRAAGINPDLSGSSGGSSISSGSSAVQPQTQGQTKFSNSYDTSATVFQGMQATASLISSLTGAVSGGFDLVKGISTFGDFLSQSASQSSMLKTAANIASQTAPGVIAAQNAENQIAVDTAESRTSSMNLDAYHKKLAFVDTLSHMLDGTKEYTDDELDSFISRVGYTDSGGELRTLMRDYMGTPQLRKYYNDYALQARASQIANVAAPYDFLLSVQQTSNQCKLQEITLQQMLGSFKQSIANLTFTDEQAQNIASAQNLDNATKVQQNKLAYETAVYELQNFFRALEVNKSAIADLDARIAEYTYNHTSRDEMGRVTNRQMTSEEIAALMSLKTARSALYTLGSQHFGEMQQIINSAYMSWFNSETSINKNGGNLRMDAFNDRYKTFMRYNYPTYLSSSDSGDGNAFNVAKDLLGMLF